MRLYARVDLHTPKMLVIQFHTAKILIIQSLTSSVWRKRLSYNFHTLSKNNRTKMKRFLRLFENSWTDWWQKKTDFKFFLKKMLAMQFPYTRQKFWKFVTNFFSFKCKSNFVAKIYFFCVHNVVLDTIILAFFRFT